MIQKVVFISVENFLAIGENFGEVYQVHYRHKLFTTKIAPTGV